MACAIALPLGLMIGRLPLVRQLLDPTLQVLRPIPVTVWLPLAMIIFGLGPRSAISLVFLGAFYPVLINTIFGVRSSAGLIAGGRGPFATRGWLPTNWRRPRETPIMVS